jgi:hypothetical protein
VITVVEFVLSLCILDAAVINYKLLIRMTTHYCSAKESPQVLALDVILIFIYSLHQSSKFLPRPSWLTICTVLSLWNRDHLEL